MLPQIDILGRTYLVQTGLPRQTLLALTVLLFFFVYTTDLHKHNTKTKSLIKKRTTEPYLIYDDQMGEMKKVFKKFKYMYA